MILTNVINICILIGMMETISWIAFVINVTAVVLNIYKNKWCWRVGLACSLLWIVYAGYTKQPALFTSQVIFACLNTYGMIKWR